METALEQAKDDAESRLDNEFEDAKEDFRDVLEEEEEFEDAKEEQEEERGTKRKREVCLFVCCVFAKRALKQCCLDTRFAYTP